MIHGILQCTSTSKVLPKQGIGARFVLDIRRTDKVQGTPFSTVTMFRKELLFRSFDLPSFQSRYVCVITERVILKLPRDVVVRVATDPFSADVNVYIYIKRSTDIYDNIRCGYRLPKG
jgi:hypothetical protein